MKTKTGNILTGRAVHVIYAEAPNGRNNYFSLTGRLNPCKTRLEIGVPDGRVRRQFGIDPGRRHARARSRSMNECVETVPHPTFTLSIPSTARSAAHPRASIRSCSSLTTSTLQPHHIYLSCHSSIHRHSSRPGKSDQIRECIVQTRKLIHHASLRGNPVAPPNKDQSH